MAKGSATTAWKIPTAIVCYASSIRGIVGLGMVFEIVRAGTVAVIVDYVHREEYGQTCRFAVKSTLFLAKAT